MNMIVDKVRYSRSDLNALRSFLGKGDLGIVGALGLFKGLINGDLSDVNTKGEQQNTNQQYFYKCLHIQ